MVVKVNTTTPVLLEADEKVTITSEIETTVVPELMPVPETLSPALMVDAIAVAAALVGPRTFPMVDPEVSATMITFWKPELYVGLKVGSTVGESVGAALGSGVG